jgi:hypothetical protein
VLSPSSSNSNLNLLDFSKIGLTPLSDSTAFKKIQYFSKVNPQSLYAQSSIDNKYSKLSDLYLKSSSTTSAYNYGTLRQHNYTVAASNQYKQNLMDKNSVDTMLSYNYNLSNPTAPSFANEHTNLLQKKTNLDTNLLGTINNTTSVNNLGINLAAENPTMQNSSNASTDIKGHSNSLKYTNFTKAESLTSLNNDLDLQATLATSLPYTSDNDSSRTFKFKDLKSPNLGFLSSEKNVRLINEVNPTAFNASMLNGVNNLDDIVSSSINDSITPNMLNTYTLSKND